MGQCGVEVEEENQGDLVEEFVEEKEEDPTLWEL